MPLLVVNSDPERLWGKKEIPNYVCFDFTSAGTGNKNLKFTSDGNLTTSAFESISYSIDECETWTTVANEGQSITINVPITDGLKVYWKGSANNLATNKNGNSSFYIDSSDYTCNISGNIMSLLYGDDFEDKTEFPEDSSNNFKGLFCPPINKSMYPTFDGFILPATTLTYGCYSQLFERNKGIITTPELPATTLATYCYAMMFVGCTSLTTAPELPATTLKIMCYTYMFKDCTSLNYVKALCTTGLGDTYSSNWLTNVAAEGTFVKAAGVNHPTAVNGIPEGWTVEEV